ncbi:MAG: hypothetical protein QHH80_02250 [Anaerolineae bacterium]|nr:hypothetical protein [Anaerolineae bacterium]
MKRKTILTALAALMALALASGAALAQQPVVRALFFYSPTCPHCEAVIKEYIPPLMQKYGRQLEIAFIDISNPQNYEGLLRLEAAYGLDSTKTGVPEVFIGDKVLTGEYAIRNDMERIVQEYLAQGGVDYPAIARINPEGTPAPTPTPNAPAKSIALAYFYKAGCQECNRVEYDLRLLESRVPGLKVYRFDVVEQAPLNEWLSQRNGVPQDKRLIAPAVFVGDDFLVDEQVTYDALSKLVDKYKATGAPAVWEGWDKDNPQAKQGILERFQSFGALTVAAAGLVDGLNPCAFATIVFFISYLAFVGRKGNDLLFVGAAFTLGVFLTYTLVGFGLLRAVQALPFMATLGRWVYIAAGVLAFVLAVLSVNDFLAARRGKPDEMRLKLPTAWRKQINKVIREGSRVRAFVAVAFATGFVVSLIELACTGQVYLPTILFVMSVPSMRAQAISYLMLYNVMFILPLIVVFGLAYAGTSSQTLAAFVNKQTATVKLLTAAIFFILAVWLLYSVV